MNKTQKIIIDAEIQAQLEGMGKVVSELQDGIKKGTTKLNISKGIGATISKEIASFEKDFERIQKLTAGGAIQLGDTKEFTRRSQHLISTFENLQRIIGGFDDLELFDAKKLFPQAFDDRVKNLKSSLSGLTKSFEAIGQKQTRKTKLEAEIKNLEVDIERLRKKAEKTIELKVAADTAGKEFEKTTTEFEDFRKELQSIFKNIKLDTPEDLLQFAQTKEGSAWLEEITQAVGEYTEAQNKATKAAKDYQETQGIADRISAKQSNITSKKQEIEQLTKSIEKLTAETNFANIKKAFEDLNKSLEEQGKGKIKLDLTEDLLKSENGIKKVIEELDKLDEQDLKTLIQSLRDLGLNAEITKELMEKFGISVGEIDDKAKGMTRAQQDMENLKDSILDFFSIGNTIQIFKNAVKNAIDTVKELDAVMTETAVVTDFSIGDMWEKLPEYTEEANKLGTSISSLYQATTLYYQQGLQSKEAMGVGVETMKMARIANMDAADATTAMTAALRGFNMEINETSATRVNDVYSELAAITAADTSQIATAMGKTASIAASANMEFETTAALLAQIIETTQEAPETAGTAMKTIIARFTEVKKLFDEGMLTGKDEEGEEININKIDEALKKVGISLKDFLKGEKGIDDIFLELASKWDTLDLATQRYIATTAAGSRQQSRFLAMMSNYDRTMELVNAANDSAGASQEQFNKTLDSLEAKLQELQNAWQQFTMGLANSDAIKWVVDVLTDILNVANQLTDFGSSGAGGFMTFLTRVLTIAMGLKSGGAVLKGLGKIFINPESQFGKSFLGEIATGSEKSFKGLGEVLGALPKKFTKITEGANAGKTAITLFGKALPFGPVAAWGAVIIAAAVTLGILIKKAHDAQTSVKLEKVNKEIKKLDESIVETKNEIQEISSAKSGLDEMNETFAGLTKGTDEWRAALIEINSQVVSLLEKYPDLESKIGENGQLTITEESWKDVLNSQQLAIENMSAMKIGLQGQVLDLEEDLLLREANSLLNKYATQQVDQEYTNSSAYVSATNGAAGAERAVDLASIYAGQGELSPKELLSLARYFSEHSISKNTIDDQNFEDIFTAAGIAIDDEFDAKVESFKDIIIQASEEFYDIVAQTEEIDVSRKQQNAAFVANAIGSSELAGGKEYTDAIANTIVGQSPEKEDYNDIIKKKVEEDTRTAEQIAGTYAEKFGYFAVGNEVYKDGTMSEKVDASTEAMRYAVVAAEVKEEVALQGQDIAESTAIKTSADLYDQLMGGQNGSDITASTLAMFKGKTPQQITKMLGYDTQAQVRKELGFNIFDQIYANLEAADERITNARETMAQNMSSQGFGITSEGIEAIEGRFAERFNDTEVRGMLDSITQSLAASGNAEIMASGWGALSAIFDVGSAEDFEHISEVITGINWDSPIQAASQIQEYINSADQTAQWFGETVAALGPKAISAGAQMEELFMSAEYSDIEVELNELLQTQEELTDADIDELTHKYSLLGQVVENTSMTTEGLSQILANVAKGKVAFEEVTDAVIAAIGYMDTLGDSTNKVLKKWQEMNFGPETSQIEGFYQTLGQDIGEFIEQGNFGDESFENRLDYLFGKDWDVGYEEDLVGRMTELGGIAQEMGNNMGSIWEKAGYGLDIFGNKVSEEALSSLEELGVQLDIVDGKLTFDIPDEMTFDEISTALAKTFSGSKELWDDLLIYMQNKDPNVRRSWLEADYNAIGKRIVEEETSRVGKSGKKFVTEQEIVTIATIQSEETGKEVEEVIDDIEEQLKDFEGEIVIVPSFEGLSEDEIKKQLYESFGGEEAFVNEYITTDAYGGGSTLDLGGMLGDLESFGISDEIAAQMANGAAEGVDRVTAIVNGETITLDVKEGENIVETYKAKLEELEEEAAGTEIAPVITPTLDQSAVAAAYRSVYEFFNGRKIPLSITVNGITGLPTGASLTLSTGTGRPGDGEIQQQAKGTDYNPKAGESLTGEEGPELVETGDGAYLVGVGGPQIAYLNRGDIVHTAEETKEIFKRGGRRIPAFKGGGLVFSGPSGGRTAGSGGASGSDEDNKWENPFDKLYNLVREIDEELRQRERIERRYEQLLTSLNSSANEIIKVSREELTQLEKERALQEELIAGRKWQIDQYQSENMDLQNYAQVTQNERGEDVLRIDWDAIEAVTDPDQGQKIEDYVSQLEEWFDELESAEDALWDIEDAVSEIKERGKDEYFDLEETIKEALVSERQDEIDRLTEIGNAINESNSELLNSIQQSIDKQRQDRENARTEEELAEKQRRLAYLQQDTSGANALEIKKLQKEIEEGREDYTDSLIDQKISDLQMQNDEAAKQRERQIEILQSQLNYYIDSGEIWRDVQSLMDTGISKVDGLVQGSALEKLLKTSGGFEGMSAIGQMEWMKETNSKIDQAISYLEIGRQLEDLGIKENSKINFTTTDGKKMTGTVDKSGNVVASNGKIYSNVFQGANGQYYAGNETIEKTTETANKVEESKPAQPSKKDNPYGAADVNNIKAIQWALNELGYNAGTVDGISGWQTRNAIMAFQKAEGITADGIYGSQTREKMRLKGYKTGGLADFTGPAWLDGTKARPEIVLNAQDSRNFIQLRDILGSLLNRSITNTSTENSGDTTYDIDINVESIGSDYDIEQIAGKIKSLINEDARYRNNNAISLQR